MIVQRAWIFRPAAFHDVLKQRVVRNDSLDAEALWREAVTACKDPSPLTQGYLTWLRVDRDDVLIQDDPPEVDHYLICMAVCLSEVRAIREILGMTGYLESLGWSKEWTRRISSGDALNSLVSRYSDPLAGAVKGRLSSEFGGWLSGKAASETLERIQDIKAAFLQPPEERVEEMLSRLTANRWTRALLMAQLRDQFHDAVGMLERVAGQDEIALRIITD